MIRPSKATRRSLSRKRITRPLATEQELPPLQGIPDVPVYNTANQLRVENYVNNMRDDPNNMLANNILAAEQHYLQIIVAEELANRGVTDPSLIRNTFLKISSTPRSTTLLAEEAAARAASATAAAGAQPEAATDMAIIIPCMNEDYRTIEGVLLGIPHDCLVILVSNSSRSPVDRYEAELRLL
ncbi:Uu.00g055560.m01.CDS01 [Anthostomella pinea]|uniref:Uu.00g055560.m01.CDS01 n=1 Tax=Anthostomella pinea TaxID=933095 RepID=A0AAI8VWV0_9PEZI|nr:Uu.00g055560.m01.CDS01 [Anthostomella pinea]